MSKVKIFWTSFALKCLEEIKDYLVQETHSESLANKYIHKLIDKVEILQNFPEAGQEEELLKHLNQNSRYLVEGSYKIIYQYTDGKAIITDVFHVKQNPVKLIRRNKKK